MMLLSNQISVNLDRLMDYYKKRLAIVDKRWDWLQDAVKAEEDAHGDDTVRYERLSEICGRADKANQEMEWRIEQVGKAYTALEEIDTSIYEIRHRNHVKRTKNRKKHEAA